MIGGGARSIAIPSERRNLMLYATPHRMRCEVGVSLSRALRVVRADAARALRLEKRAECLNDSRIAPAR